MTARLTVARLRLARFRSYLRADLEFDGRSVAVHGPNGAGKTNLIEALSLLSPGRGLRGAASEDLASTAGPGGWKIEADLAGPDGPHEIATRSDGSGRSVTIDGKSAPQTGLGAVVRVLWLTPAMDRLWVEAASDRRRFLDRLTLSLIPAQAEAVLGYDRALRERNRLIRDGLRDAGWLAALEARLATYGATTVAHRRRALAELAAAPDTPGFPRADLTLAREGPEDADGLAAALREGRGRDFAAGRTLSGPHRDDLEAVYADKAMPARVCSTGEQKAMLISLILANAAAVARGFGAAPILLLDEVAAHLDADRRAALHAALAALGCQAFLTGADRALFAGIKDVLRLRVEEGSDGSVVAPV